MTWSLSLLILTGIPIQQHYEQLGPHFTSYRRGYDVAREQKKPLLLIMHAGPQRTESPVSLVSVRRSRERRQLLKNYVVVAVDATTPHGRAVHRVFEKPKLPHVVVLDKWQKFQIFTTSEMLYGQRWTEILKTYRTGVRPRVVPPQYCAT